MITGIISSARFLYGAVAAFLASKTLEEAFGSGENQSTFTRVMVGIGVGMIVAIFIEYLKKRKII